MNRNFAKPRADMTPEFAPDVLVIDGRKVYGPKAVHCRIAGYLPLIDERPMDPPEGKHYERTGKIEPDGASGYRWVYMLVDNPPPAPRTFSKLKVVAALTSAGVWPQVKAWIEQAGLYDLYLAAQDFAEDNEYFAQGLAALKPVVGWTDEQVEELLAQCVKSRRAH